MRNQDHGFTISEVLVATTLTLIVLSSGATLFTRSLEISDTARLSGNTNHTMQAAMTMMVRDFMQAGQGIPRGGIPIPSGAGSVAIIRPAPPASALTFNNTWVTMPAIATGGGLGPAVLGIATDMVTILYADVRLPLNQFPLQAIAANGSSMTVNAGTNIGGPDGISAGDLILFSNALGNAIQHVSAVNNQVVTFASPDPFRFNQRTAPVGSIMALQSSPGNWPPTTAQRVWMVNYYLDNVTDPSLPRLVRQVNFGQRLAIALGAENLQFTYDLVNGITNPTNVETPLPPLSPHQIRKANLYLAARSMDRSMPTNQFLRNSMAISVGLRSLTFVDRYK
jgi:hypothetical protein